MTTPHSTCPNPVSSRRPVLLRAALSSTLLLCLSALLVGQGLSCTPSLSGSGVPSDSTRLLGEAKDAQRAFERLHRSHLPRSGDQGGGSCDEWIGRICLRWTGGMDWSPRPEDPVVAAGRERLLEALAAVAGEIPGDRWVMAQRIRYLGDVGRWREALAIARECQGGEPWWCPALLGYVFHRSGLAHDALQAFDVALERMDGREAARWRDPSPVLDYPAARWIRDPGMIPRAEALDRFWRLADPLFLTPGNEGLTEHLSRVFGAHLYAGAAISLGGAWGKGLEELLVRYGFTAGWERTWPRMNEVSGGSVVEHHHPEIRGLLPPLEALEDPAGLLPGVWVPRDDRPRSAMAPVLAPLVVEGRGQTAVLRRGADLLVLAAYAPPVDTLLQQRRGEGTGSPGGGSSGFSPPPWEIPGDSAATDTLSGLFLLGDTGTLGPLSALSTGGEGTLLLRAPPGGYLLSLELWSPSGRWASRVRQGIRGGPVPPDVPVLSDLLLLLPGTDLPEELPDAIPRLRRGTDLRGGEPLTVGWEVYGLGLRREPLTFRLSLVEEGGSFLRRALEGIGLSQRGPSLTLSWEEAGADEVGPLFRAVDLDLPPLGPGQYVLRLEMEIPNRSKVVANRRIRVF